jgi:sulfopyruvate decarboxylase subunit alpha
VTVKTSAGNSRADLHLPPAQAGDPGPGTAGSMPGSPPGLTRRYLPEAAERIAGAMAGNGVDLAVVLPDSVLHGVNHVLSADPRVNVIGCAREDEGVAIAMGAAFTGRRPAVLMEGSGIGYSGLSLARAVAVNRAEILLVVGHVWALGERFHYHAATRAAAEPLLSALRIPYHVLTSVDEADLVFREIMKTMSGQRTPVAVLVPRYLTMAW